MKHNSPTIVAIDDIKDNLVALNAFIADAFPGASVFSAQDGKHGIELAREKNPDVVLLDILMPGMDGFEVCRQLKADPHTSHIPVVFLTALKDDKKSRIRALEVGGEAFISKPFDEAELTAQIRAMVKIKAANEREWREKERLAELVADRTSQLEMELAERKKAEMELGLANQVLEKNKTAMLNLLEDLQEEIEARKKSESALAESEERFRFAMRYLPATLWAVDTNLHFTLSQGSVLASLGLEPNQIVGTSLYDYFQTKDPGHMEIAAHLRALNGEIGNYDFDYKGITFRTIVAPMRDSQGRVNGVVGIALDITERKLAEDTLLRVNQKLNILSDLTRKDLTSQIFILNSYLEMAKKQAAGQDQIINSIQKGEKAARSINEITEITRDYQDMGAKPPTWQSVKMTLLLGLSHITVGDIRHSIETEDLGIFADPLLEKACQGLFENSMAHGGHVTRIRVWYTTTPGGVTIFFEDDGIGIPEEKRESIFLRSGGARTSVRGLFFVREILDITGITIRENGEPGKGARFEIVVPKGMWRIEGMST